MTRVSDQGYKHGNHIVYLMAAMSQARVFLLAV